MLPYSTIYPKALDASNNIVGHNSISDGLSHGHGVTPRIRTASYFNPAWARTPVMSTQHGTIMIHVVSHGWSFLHTRRQGAFNRTAAPHGTFSRTPVRDHHLQQELHRPLLALLAMPKLLRCRSFSSSSLVSKLLVLGWICWEARREICFFLCIPCLLMTFTGQTYSEWVRVCWILNW